MRLAKGILIISSGFAAHAQTGIHACQAEPAIQKIYSQNSNSPNRSKAFRDALATNPDDLFLNYWLIGSPDVHPGDFAAEYRAKLAARPGQPLFLYLYGRALVGKDTAQSIRLIQEALTKDPEIAYAYGTLLEIYSSPHFRDRRKLLENLKAYTTRCPGDATPYRYLSNVEDPAALKEMVLKYRAAVEAHQAIGSVDQYPRLWAVEFRVADPKTYDKLRDRVRTDMQKIRELDPSNKKESRSLIEGYRLLGDTASADALQTKRTPAKTFHGVFNEWTKAHGPHIDYEQMLPASEQWVNDWPSETNAWYWRMLAIAHSKNATAQEIEKAGQDVLDSNAKTFMGWTSSPYPLSVAEVWADHNVRLQDCLVLVRQAEKELTGNSMSYDDRRPGSTAPESSIAYGRFRLLVAESLVDRKLKDYDAARMVLARMRAWTSAHPEDINVSTETMAWHDESGALAEAEGHKPDALAQYQLGTQLSQPKSRAQALWAEMGGTPEGFSAWWTRPELPRVPRIPLDLTHWTTKSQPLTALNTHDQRGKTWTISELRGKKTLINVWATWCEPCRQELPYVQRLYERTKEREDIQVITISTDEDPGLLDPFLKAGHYTFPVLLAKTLVEDLTESVSIPRNWIVDMTGVLREEGIGFSAAEWPEKILARLEASARLP